jgi:serine/threonine protein kinase
LERRVASGKIGFKEVLAALALVARTVNMVHQFGLVHRNLCPSNVLIAEDGTPALIGFGCVGVNAGVAESDEGIVACTTDVDLEQFGRMLIWLRAEIKQPLPRGMNAICQRYSTARLPGSPLSAAVLADELDGMSREANRA